MTTISPVKGPLSFKDIRTVKNIVYPIFISGHFLRKLFVTILFSNSVKKLDELWNKTWEWLSDGILYNERKIVGRPGNIYKLFVIVFQYCYCIIT